MSKDFLELSELLARVKECVADAFPDRYWVKGEISSWSPRVNGHCYLNLSETVRGRQVADIRAMSWKWQQELALPKLPYALAVITSKTAASCGDFRRHLLEHEAGYAFRLDLFEALMRGEQAPRTLRLHRLPHPGIYQSEIKK